MSALRGRTEEEQVNKAEESEKQLPGKLEEVQACALLGEREGSFLRKWEWSAWPKAAERTREFRNGKWPSDLATWWLLGILTGGIFQTC